MADARDILNEDDERLSDEELLKYLHDQSSEQEKHAIEKKSLNDPFDEEALEGLSSIKQKDNLQDYVQQLNKNLQKQLDNKKQRTDKRKIKDIPLLLLAIILILFICLASYLVIYLQNKKQKKPVQKEATSFVLPK